MNWLWLIGGLGGLGIAGYIAALFLAPALAAVVGDFFVKFINSRVGLAVIVGLGSAFGAGLYVWRNETSKCAREIASINVQWQAKIDEAAKQFAQARKDRDAREALMAKQLSEQAQKQLADNDAAWQQTFADWKKNHVARCIVTKEDLGIK